MTERAYGQDLDPSAQPEPTREVAGDSDRRLPGVYTGRRRGLRPGDPAIWNDGLQDINVTIEHRGRDAVGIYCRVSYICADGTTSVDRIHPSQLRAAP